jgi:hypothetical protein
MLLRKFFANMLNYIDDQIPAISNSYLRKLNHCTYKAYKDEILFQFDAFNKDQALEYE